MSTRQGPGRTRCHFHCQTHYTTEDDGDGGGGGDSPSLCSSRVLFLLSSHVRRPLPPPHAKASGRASDPGLVGEESQVKCAEHTLPVLGRYALICSWWGKLHNPATREELLKTQGREEEEKRQDVQQPSLTRNIDNQTYGRQPGEVPNQLKYGQIEVL